MTHLNGTKLIDGLGGGATDKYGLGYDVILVHKLMSLVLALVLREFTEGDHDDFIDTDNKIRSRENGTVTMSAGKSDRGATWKARSKSIRQG